MEWRLVLPLGSIGSSKLVRLDKRVVSHQCSYRYDHLGEPTSPQVPTMFAQIEWFPKLMGWKRKPIEANLGAFSCYMSAGYCPNQQGNSIRWFNPFPGFRKGLGYKMRRCYQQIQWILAEGPIKITRLHTRQAGETGFIGLNDCFTSNHLNFVGFKDTRVFQLKQVFLSPAAVLNLTYI